jgi:hypothetical protein
MKAIGLTSTYSSDALTEADAIVGRLSDVRVAKDGAQLILSFVKHS